ncbi:MAG: hypothetical protein ACLGHC_03310 [Alphaproteobacteria bacterium]
MAKKVQKKKVSIARSRAKPSAAAKSAKRPKAASTRKSRAKPSPKPRVARAQSGKGAADALASLLESPIVADVLAAGAAAALAVIAQRGLSRRGEGGSKAALKGAAKAAATAMGTRIAEEIDEIMKSAKESKRGGA